MKANIFATIFFTCIALTACTRNAPVRVEAQDHPMSSNKIVFITATENDITVTNVEFNEGACIGSTYNGLPKTLKMGQPLQMVTNCISLVKVHVETDSGSSEFSF